VTGHGDPLRDICDQLAATLPALALLTPEPDSPVTAAPGMTSRAPAAPLPGNPQAFYALTSIWASARWAEQILRYALGAVREPCGGSDGNTRRLLERAIPRLAAGVDDDTYSMVITELSRRLNDALSVPAIDEAEQWRPLGRARRCPHCRCPQLHAALDAAGRPTGHIECFTYGCQDGNGYRPAAQATTDDHGRPVLAWADGTIEPAVQDAA
jgi:hypothetical protein